MGLVHVEVSGGRASPPWETDALSEEEAARRVRRYARFLEAPRPALFIVSRAGDVGAAGRQTRAFLDEIASLRANPSFQPRHLTGGQADEMRAFGSR
jgi:hypothetical protein